MNLFLQYNDFYQVERKVPEYGDRDKIHKQGYELRDCRNMSSCLYLEVGDIVLEPKLFDSDGNPYGFKKVSKYEKGSEEDLAYVVNLTSNRQTIKTFPTYHIQQKVTRQSWIKREYLDPDRHNWGLFLVEFL